MTEASNLLLNYQESFQVLHINYKILQYPKIWRYKKVILDTQSTPIQHSVFFTYIKHSQNLYTQTVQVLLDSPASMYHLNTKSENPWAPHKT